MWRFKADLRVSFFPVQLRLPTLFSGTFYFTFTFTVHRIVLPRFSFTSESTAENCTKLSYLFFFPPSFLSACLFWRACLSLVLIVLLASLLSVLCSVCNSSSYLSLTLSLSLSLSLSLVRSLALFLSYNAKNLPAIKKQHSPTSLLYAYKAPRVFHSNLTKK